METLFTTLFQLSNFYIMPFWLLMIFLPTWRWTERIIGSLWTVVPVSILYAVGIIVTFSTNPGAMMDIANPNLAGIAQLIGTPAGASVAWAHFVAFDLFVGRWAYLDSRRRGVSVWLTSPALFFVLMSGPLGLLIYLAVRRFATRSATTALA